MVDPGASEVLSSKHRVVAVLVLLVDAKGEVVHGEVHDPCGSPPRMFVSLEALGGLMQEWVAGEAGSAQITDAGDQAGTLPRRTSHA